MNIKGCARGAPLDLAAHLQKHENEAVWVIGVHDVVAQDIGGALCEMNALGAGLKTSKTLYHMQISPAPRDPALTPEQIAYAVKVALEKLELEQQPHMVVGHRKAGKDGIVREHYHVVASRTDLENNRAISDSHNYFKHELAAREIERTLGHERVQGAHAERFGVERPERTPSAAEMRQAERGAVPAKEAKALGAEIWTATDSGKAISAALAAQGWHLARGDKERKDGGAYFMAIDPHGHAHELRRMVPVKAAELYGRMADVDPAMLPSVKEAQQHARETQRDTARAADQVKHAGAERQEPRPAANQNEREAMTIDAIRRDPWKAVDLELPKDADAALLAAASRAAGQCARAAEAHARVDRIVRPEEVPFDLERGQTASARRDEAARMLAGLPPEQRTVSPFLDGERMREAALENIIGLSGGWPAAPLHEPVMTDAEIDRDPWSVLRASYKSLADASPELVERVIDTAASLRDEALRRRDEDSYSPEEKELWDELAAIATDSLKQAQSHPSRDGKGTWSFAEMERPDRTAEAVQPDYAAADPAQIFGASAERTTGPGIFDRDAENAEWMNAVEAEAIRAAERDDGKGQRDDIRSDLGTAARETTARPAGTPEPEAAPAAAAEPNTPASGPERAAQEPISEAQPPRSRADPEAANAERGFFKFLGGMTSMATKLFDALADMIAPAPPPTKEQVKQQERAEAQQQEHEARVERPAAEQEARFQEILEQMRRDDQRRRQANERGVERDDGGGRERER